MHVEICILYCFFYILTMMVWNATVYEIMNHANRVNSVFCIDFFPFKMHVTYLQRVYKSSR